MNQTHVHFLSRHNIFHILLVECRFDFWVSIHFMIAHELFSFNEFVWILGVILYSDCFNFCVACRTLVTNCHDQNWGEKIVLDSCNVRRYVLKSFNSYELEDTLTVDKVSSFFLWERFCLLFVSIVLLINDYIIVILIIMRVWKSFLLQVITVVSSLPFSRIDRVGERASDLDLNIFF